MLGKRKLIFLGSIAGASLIIGSASLAMGYLTGQDWLELVQSCLAYGGGAFTVGNIVEHAVKAGKGGKKCNKSCTSSQGGHLEQ